MKPSTWNVGLLLCLLAARTSVAHAEARFRLPSRYPLPASPVAAVAADFDGDCALDLASVTSSGQAVVLLGRGNGTFRAPRLSLVTAAVPNRVNGLAALDADHDGHRDLVVSIAPTPESCAAVVLRGGGDGRFVSSVTLPIVPSEDGRNFGCNAVLAEDFNHDGNADVVLVYGFIPNGGTPPLRTAFNVFFGHGDGTFAPALSQELAGNNSSLAATTGDIDGDGKRDLVFGEDVVFLSGPMAHEVVTFLGDGSGLFPTQIGQDATSSVGFARFEAVNATDYDGDGALDVALVADLSGFGNTPGTPKNAITLHGHGDGSFDPPVVFASTAGANSLESADFDCDGAPDLAIASFTDAGGGGSLFHGEGDGTFGAPTQVALSDAPQSLIAADFDQDGRVDLAAVDAVANVVAVALNMTPRRSFRCFPR